MADLTLAIIPLIILAVEHYSDVSKVVSRYRHLSDRIDEFFSELDVQCRIFETSVQLLLTSAVGDEQAARMLRDENDVGWNDAYLDCYMSQRFPGSTASAVRSCLDLIRRQLVKLSEGCKTFHFVVEKVEKDEKVSLKKKARRIAKKINIACSNGGMDVALKSLRDRTEDFRVLVQQSERIGEAPTQEPSRVAKAKVRQFVAVKSTANNLYTAFGQACTKHTEHQGYIGLQPTHNDSDHVNFVLAFKSLTIQSASRGSNTAGADVLWFTIESTITGSICPSESNGVLESLNKSAKRTLDASPLDSKGQTKTEGKLKKPKKVVSFQLNPLGDCLLSRAPSSPARVSPSDSLVNLCSHNNFCNQVQKVFGQPRLPKHRCIGYLETTGSSKHLVYIHSRMDNLTTMAHSTEIVALGDLLKVTTPSIQLSGFQSLHRRIRLGKQLALALLQFHETCWLKDSWSSDDILISDADADKQADSTQVSDSAHESYANVSIRGQVVVAEQRVTRPQPYIRNRPLFNLGKILLELAFQKRFHRFDKPEDLEPNLTADSEDFFTAKKLLCSVPAKLGTRFAKVVERCIECDFAQGTDLNSEQLQASFYQFVICELEICEKLACGR